MFSYEIQLLNVVIPNQTLSVGNGKRMPYYPYLYVELANVSSSGAGQRGIIYSNNPNSTKMLFRACIDDTNFPRSSNFLRFDGDGIVQTIKFKPNDNLKFSVHLYTGEVFQTVEAENYSPLPPNPDIQISAVFCLSRLDYK